ncbi:MAG: hypothetical protein NTW16_12570 [Bacteroidetes bacterium]|nr:hypothetical protein [Bacteroidota bacterium]
MEEKDPIGNKFKSSFSDFEKEPPVRVWENLQKELHLVPKPAGFWAHFSAFSFFTKVPVGFYLSLGVIVVSIFSTVVYKEINRRHTIRGHAYAGEIRLRNGSAELYQVTDKTLPWDSVTHYHTSVIDNYGHFQFSKVGEGKYLLHIVPDGKSQMSTGYISSWFDRCENSDSCNVIIINRADKNLEVHLVKNSKTAQ